MRLHFDAMARHFFFVDAHDLAQAVEFLAHFVQNLADGVDFDVAALVAFHRESNRNVLGKFQQGGLVRRIRGRLRRQGRERLADGEARASRQSGKPRLERLRIQFLIGTFAGARDLRRASA